MKKADAFFMGTQGGENRVATALKTKCKHALGAVYNSNLPPLQGEARSGGGMGRGWTMPLTR